MRLRYLVLTAILMLIFFRQQGMLGDYCVHGYEACERSTKNLVNSIELYQTDNGPIDLELMGLDLCDKLKKGGYLNNKTYCSYMVIGKDVFCLHHGFMWKLGFGPTKNEEYKKWENKPGNKTFFRNRWYTGSSAKEQLIKRGITDETLLSLACTEQELKFPPCTKQHSLKFVYNCSWIIKGVAALVVLIELLFLVWFARGKTVQDVLEPNNHTLIYFLSFLTLGYTFLMYWNSDVNPAFYESTGLPSKPQMLVMAVMFGVATGFLNGFVRKKVPHPKRGLPDFIDCFFSLAVLSCAYDVASSFPKHLWGATCAGCMVTALLSALVIRKFVAFLIYR